MTTPATGPLDAPSFFQLARRSFWLLFGGIFLVAGLVLTLIGAGMAWQQGRFASDGLTAQGVVLGKTIRQADAGENRSTEYHVRYRFANSDGAPVDASDQVSFDRWEALVEGGPVTIEYLAGDPGLSRVQGGDDAILLILFIGVGLSALAIGMGISIWQLRRLRATHRLWREGVATEAVVVRVEPANVTFNNRPLFRIRYEYGDPAGGRHNGTSGLVAWEEAEAWQPGDRGTVRYDPHRPDVSTWIGEASGPPVPEPA